MERMIQVEKENVEQSVVVEREPMTLNIGGTTDYNGLSNKPSINGTTLSGNKSLSDLGINIPDVSDFITKDVNDLTYYTLATNTGSTIELTINNSTYVMTLNLKNASGTTISTQSIDLPLETMVVNGSYDSTNKKVILTLQNGNTVDFSVADLVSGLQSEITSNNKLSSDLVDDTNHTNKFVTSAEKEKINIITSNGTGNNYLANDGTYKEIDLSSYAPKTTIGDLEDLDTTDKSDIVSAINEVASSSMDDVAPVYILKTTDTLSEYTTLVMRDTSAKQRVGEIITKIMTSDTKEGLILLHSSPTNTRYLLKSHSLHGTNVNSYTFKTSALPSYDSNLQSRLYTYKQLRISGLWNNNVYTCTDLRFSVSTMYDLDSFIAKNNTNSYNVTNDYNPAHKKYVDDSISSAVGDIETILTTLTTGNGV